MFFNPFFLLDSLVECLVIGLFQYGDLHDGQVLGMID